MPVRSSIPSSVSAVMVSARPAWLVCAVPGHRDLRHRPEDRMPDRGCPADHGRPPCQGHRAVLCRRLENLVADHASPSEPDSHPGSCLHRNRTHSKRAGDAVEPTRQHQHFALPMTATACPGGCLDRKNDPPPGRPVILRGFSRSADLADGVQTPDPDAPSPCGQSRPPPEPYACDAAGRSFHAS